MSGNDIIKNAEKDTHALLHDAAIERVRREMPSDVILGDLADLYKVFGDSTRVKILYALFESELCVCAIAELLGMTQSAISHQLRVLRRSKLVGCRRDNKNVFYFLADDHVAGIIGCGMEHVCEERDGEEEEDDDEE